MPGRRALVVGAGVSGLTTGLCLQERGFEVRILARELPPHTTSDLPAALFHPYRAEPYARVAAWTRRSFARFQELAADPASGVRLLEGIEVYRQEAGEPWWNDLVPSYRRAAKDELPPAGVAGFVFGAAVIETPLYLPWLVDRFRKAGGRLERGEAADLDTLARGGETVVVCAGLGARELAKDPSLYPSRGQLAYLEPVALDRFALELPEPGVVTYVVPRRDAVVVGSTVEDGVESAAVEPAAIEAMLARARALVPAIAGARLLRTAAGLRPCRPSVRLEAERLEGGGLVVHNYGHGGAGHTLSWGCAEEAAALVLSAPG